MKWLWDAWNWIVNCILPVIGLGAILVLLWLALLGCYGAASVLSAIFRGQAMPGNVGSPNDALTIALTIGIFFFVVTIACRSNSGRTVFRGKELQKKRKED